MKTLSEIKEFPTTMLTRLGRPVQIFGRVSMPDRPERLFFVGIDIHTGRNGCIPCHRLYDKYGTCRDVKWNSLDHDDFDLVLPYTAAEQAWDKLSPPEQAACIAIYNTTYRAQKITGIWLMRKLTGLPPMDLKIIFESIIPEDLSNENSL